MTKIHHGQMYASCAFKGSPFEMHPFLKRMDCEEALIYQMEKIDIDEKVRHFIKQRGFVPPLCLGLGGICSVVEISIAATKLHCSPLGTGAMIVFSALGGGLLFSAAIMTRRMASLKGSTRQQAKKKLSIYLHRADRLERKVRLIGQEVLKLKRAGVCDSLTLDQLQTAKEYFERRLAYYRSKNELKEEDNILEKV